MDVTFSTFQSERPTMDSSDLQPENILPMSPTWVVFQPERLRVVSELQPLNMESVFPFEKMVGLSVPSFVVFQPERSREVSELQFWNMHVVVHKEEVSQLERPSMLRNEEQLLNIETISVTLEVFLKRSRDVRERQP